MMFSPRFALAIVLLLPLSSCGRQESVEAGDRPQTIDNMSAPPIAIEKLPELEDQIIPKAASGATGATGTSGVQAATAVMPHGIALPYAPAIAMDPVDGSKISITSATPVAEYNKRLFYFSEEGNRRIFLSNPEQYAKGPLATY